MKKTSRSFMHITLTCLILFVLSIVLPGCAPMVRLEGGPGVGIAGYKYYMGEMTVIFEANFMDTWDATVTALNDMQIYVDRKEHGLTKGKILAKRADNKPIRITIEYKSSEETELRIKIGKLGDKDTSAAITEKTREVLFEK